MPVDPRQPPHTSPIVESLTWPTRAAQINRVLDSVAAGNSVVVSYAAPDGAQHLASALSDALSTTSKVPVVHADPSSDLNDVLGVAEEAAGIRVILAAHLLPDEVCQRLEERLSAPGSPPLVFLVDIESFDGLKVSATATVMGLLSRLWGQDWLVRVDLTPLSDIESLELARRYDPQTLLDELQLATAAATGAGSPLLVADLTEDALVSASAAPRHLARPGVDATVFSPRTTLRAATLVRSIEPELASAAHSIAYLGPLPVSVANQVFGSATIDRLLSRRIAHRVDDRHRRCVWVSTLMLSALTDHVPGQAERLLDFARHQAKLEHLWAQGGVTTDTTIATLALLRQGAESSEFGQRLAAEAAAVTARWGAVPETNALLRTAEPLPPTQTTPVRAALIAGEHALALERARHVIEASGSTGALSLDAVYDAAVACSWLDEAPSWFDDVLSRRVEAEAPGLATTLRISMSDLPLGPADLPSLRDLVTNPTAHLAARLLACAHWCRVCRDTGDAEGLEAALAASFELLARAEAHSDQPDSRLLEDSRLLMRLTSIVTRVVTGVQRGDVEHEIAALSRAAVQLGHRTGWLASSIGLVLQGIQAALAGQNERAIKNLRAATLGLRPAIFAPIYAAISSLTVSVWPEFAPSPASSELIGLHGTAMDKLGTAARLSLEALISSSTLAEGKATRAVPWMVSMRWHTAVLQGEVVADVALQELRNIPRPCPLTQARTQHVAAIAAQDKDALFACAAPLASLGLLSAARAALVAARGLYLASRATIQALRCTQALEELNSLLPWEHEAQLVRDRPPADLSERELEVARLVAGGLSNTDIAKKLFLSVRTVESHVLRARAKLGAAGRADVRHRLEQAGDAG